MLVFVAVRAEQFPIAAIRSVVVVGIVLVMNFQQLQIGMIERARSVRRPRETVSALVPGSPVPFFRRCVAPQGHPFEKILLVSGTRKITWEFDPMIAWLH